MDSRRVEEDNLRVVVREDTLNAATGRLRLIGGYRDLLTDDFINERRFSDVWASNDGYEARFILHIDFLLQSN